MKHGMQIKIAKRADISAGYLSDIINTKRRPSWSTAKRLAEVTGTWPTLWLEADTRSIRAALSKNKVPPPANSKKNIIQKLFGKWGKNAFKSN